MTSSNRKVIEAILLLADEPVPARAIGEVLEVARSEVSAELDALARSYEAEDRGFVLREVAGGWRLYTHPDCAPWLERFALSHARARLSGAALETLAIVAYRGPLARSEIAEIRGVDSDGVVNTLAARGLIAAAGTGPARFSVTPEFLERMGINSLEELPRLADFMPDADAVEEMEAKLSPGA
jgi:segregation and condensation protein B